MREGARLHFISFETRQIEKVATDLKLHNLLSIFDNHRSKLYPNLHSKNQEFFLLPAGLYYYIECNEMQF